MRADGLDVEEYEGTEGRGLLFPTDGSFQPLERCRVLAQRAVERGALLFEQSRATSIAGGEVRTNTGSVICNATIVAVDGNLELLIPELRGRVRTARLQMLGTAPLAQMIFPRPVYSRWGYDYWQQLPDLRVVLGGHRDAFAEHEWTSDNAPTSEIQNLLDGTLAAIGVDAPVTHRWAASVGYTETGLPIVDEVRPRVWAIGGYSGTGNVIGALYGRMLAQLVATGRSSMSDVLAP